MKKKKKKQKHALISKKPAAEKKKLPVIINEDIVTEILLRLPTKSIFKFKCISKTWLKIITDPWFANAYKSFNAVLPVFAGFFCVNSNSNHKLIFHPLKHCLESPSMNTLPLNLQDLSISSVLSSNGLLLLCTTDGQKIVCNPVTGRRLMIPKMKDNNTEWYHAFGLIHEKDNHVKAVFAYELAIDDIQTALFLTKWQCRTKNIEFRVYCSRKNEWNCNRLVSKFSRNVCFDLKQMGGVSIGDNLYWITEDGEVLVYNNMIKSEASTTELIGAPASMETFVAKTIYTSGNGILAYCAKDKIMKNVVIIWELMNDQKSWVTKQRVMIHGLNIMQKIFYFCHETQALFIHVFNLVFRYSVSGDKLLCEEVDQVTPYMMSPWPAAINGDEGWPSSSSSSSSPSPSPSSSSENCKGVSS